MSETSASVELEPVEHIQATLLNRIESGQLRLPLLPQVANQVLMLTSDPDADVTKLAALFQQDQALATQMLKIANSPAYMPRTPIVSLQQAVAWLGMKLLSDLALTVSVQNGVFRVRGYEKQVGELWRHALASGLFAKEIARQCRQNVESAFLSGLLHTIGKPVVLEAIIDIQESMSLSLEWEQIDGLLHTHHAQVGSLVTESWGLPDLIKDAILYYDHYQDSTKSQKVAMITCLADYCALALLTAQGWDEPSLTQLPVIQDLNLYAEDITSLMGHEDMILKSVNAMCV
ncbi:MAG: HDOD domain-containing protein [Nitrospirota bacterium]|nr:HDOD domain-containing protein [Nitrospirota bacterium]